MIDLTVIILTKNEEKNIRKCIESFKGIAERFVVVDSFSTDRTESICRELGVDFYQNKFISHAKQFNWALKNTDIETEWIMRIDADEELTLNLVEELKEKLPSIHKSINGVQIKRRTYFMGRWIKYGGIYPTTLLRIFRNNKGYSEEKNMDEHIVLTEGDSVIFEHDFIDDNTKDLEWWTNKHNWYSNKELLDYYELKEEISNYPTNFNTLKNQASRKKWLKNKIYFNTPLLIRANWYFVYRYIFKLGFLDGKEGLIFHFLQGYWYRFLVDAKIYECQKFNKIIRAQYDLNE